MDTALVLFLIFLNGLFAMSEMALTASRKARLQVMVESGEGGAQAAMVVAAPFDHEQAGLHLQRIHEKNAYLK